MPSERTLVTSIRYRPTTLATIVKFLHKSGRGTKSVGETLRYAYESFEEMILDKFPECKFPNEHEALAFLAGFGFNLDSSKDNQRLLHKLLSLESLESSQEDSQVMDIIRREMEKRGEITPDETITAEKLDETLSTIPNNVVVDEKEDNND